MPEKERLPNEMPAWHHPTGLIRPHPNPSLALLSFTDDEEFVLKKAALASKAS